MTGKLWVPETARERMGICNICGESGPYRDMQAHMGDCARENIDAIRAAAPSQKWKGTAMDRDTWNPEVEDHLARVGKRMLAEGRLEMRPNERVENE